MQCKISQSQKRERNGSNTDYIFSIHCQIMQILMQNYYKDKDKIMDKFQSILNDAARLKEAQLKNQRKSYQSLPEFLKAGLAYSKKYSKLRQQNYYLQHYTAEKLKDIGNQLYQASKYLQAYQKYQQALSIFRYIIASTTQNIKDSDLTYHTYSPQPEHLALNNAILHILYLNICSCLTKLNKKEDAIFSADQALKIENTPKAHYRKAHAYLDYINRTIQDVKIGFSQLHICFNLSKDNQILQQMHKIKKQIDEQGQKQKSWFKFMFKENSKQSEQKQNKENKQIKQNKEIISQQPKISRQKQKKINEFIQQAKQASALQKSKDKDSNDQQKNGDRLDKTKQRLNKYINLPNQVWKFAYQRDFLLRHGQKIYSLLLLYNYNDYLESYKNVIKECDNIQNKTNQQISNSYGKYIEWLRCHPFQKVKRYIQRYDVQTKWIIEKRKEFQVNEKLGKDMEEKEKRNSYKKMKPKLWHRFVIFIVIVFALVIWRNI